MQNTKTKILDTFDTFERKYIKGDGIWFIVAWFWLYAFLSILIGAIFGLWEITIVEKVWAYQIEDNVNERAFNLITKYEGFHDKPYWDYKQWSCGYWMRCSKDTKNITKEKSKQFVMERIKHIRERHNLYDIDDSIEVALISFTYNLGTPPEGYRWFIKHWYINGLKNRMKQYSYAGGKYMRGLYIRRVDESSFKN